MGYKTYDGTFVDYDEPDVPAYTPVGGGEEVSIEELPRCCWHSAHQAEGSFECPSCGAVWTTVDDMLDTQWSGLERLS